MNEIMFYGGIAGIVLFGGLVVFLFIRFRIFAVISSLTGLDAKRSIHRLQQEIEFPNDTNPISARSGKTTSKLQKGRSGRMAAEQSEETTLLTEEGNKSLFYVVQDVEIINTVERI